MRNNWSIFLGLIAVVLFLSSPVAGQRGGGGHGGGGHGGGGGGHGGGGFGGGGGSGFSGKGGGGGGGSGFSCKGGGGGGGGSGFSGKGGGGFSGKGGGGGGQSHGSSHFDAFHHVPGGPGGHPHNYGPSPFGGRYVGPHHPDYGWHHGYWNDHWVHPWHYGPVAWWSAGFVSGALVWDSPWHWGYWPYYNPYYTQVVVIDNTTTIDYSQPIAVAAPAAPRPGAPAADSTVAENQAVQLLNASRAAFARGDYSAAMSLVNQSIAKNPGDPTPHEFRGLILFAAKQYKEAAAAVYAVLSMGPGWDWATMSSFYPSVDIYTGQLRALEQYRNENPKLPEVRFLLAYHYMSCGFPDAATGELKEVVRLNPKDQLSAQLLAGQTDSEQEAPPEPTQPAVPPKPVQAADLIGDWTATRAEGESFAFSLTADATYTWKYAHAGKTQDFSGGYTVADNLLILKQNGNPVMIGQITMLDGGRFNFKLAGNNPNDPGLTFGKK